MNEEKVITDGKEEVLTTEQKIETLEMKVTALDAQTSSLQQQTMSNVYTVDNKISQLKNDLGGVKIDGQSLGQVNAWSNLQLTSKSMMDASISSHASDMRINSLGHFIKNLSNTEIKEYISSDTSDLILLKFIKSLSPLDFNIRTAIQSSKDNWGRPFKAMMMEETLKK